MLIGIAGENGCGKSTAAKILKEHKTLFVEYELSSSDVDSSTIEMMTKIIHQGRARNIVITGVRSSDQAGIIRENGGKTVMIERGTSKSVSSFKPSFRPDIILDNNGSLKDLEEGLNSIMEMINWDSSKSSVGPSEEIVWEPGEDKASSDLLDRLTREN